MAETNGEFPDDRAVEILGDDSKTEALKIRISALEQENVQLVHEKDVVEKRISELQQTIEEVGNEKDKIFRDLEASKAEIKTLESVAARAAELEGEVSRLQHDLISTTSELGEVNGELSGLKWTLDGFKKRDGEKLKEFEAVVAERDLLIGKLGKMEAEESQYLSEMNEKEKEIGSLRVKVEELIASALKSGDDRKIGDNEKRELEMRVGELEKKLKEKEKVINGIEEERGIRETIVVEGKTGGLMTGDINLGWQVIAGSALGFGLLGVVFYLHQAKRT